MRWLAVVSLLLLLPAPAEAFWFRLRIQLPIVVIGHPPTRPIQVWEVVPITKPATPVVAPSDSVFVNQVEQAWAVSTIPEEPATSAYDDSLVARGETTAHVFHSDKPNYRVLRTICVVATAYNSRRAQTDGTPWRTATGRLVQDGDIACNFLPFGTLVRILDGPARIRGKIFRVEDRLADPPPFGWNQVDIWMYRISDAVAFGKKSLTIQVLGDPVGEAPH